MEKPKKDSNNGQKTGKPHQSNLQRQIPENPNDEVESFKLGRYIGSTEACWRLLNFDIHQHFPPVEALGVHLPGQQILYFDPTREIDNPDKDTTLTAFFELCKQDIFAKDLLYVDVPKHYLWKGNKWVKRKNNEHAIGRVFTVPPSEQELHCLRLLLFTVKGPDSFESLRTFEGVLCLTFKEAARKHGLLEDDQQYIKAMEEAKFSDTAFKMRQLFVTIITSCDISDPKRLWENFNDDLSDDLIKDENGNEIKPEHRHNEALIILEDMFLDVSGKNLKHYGLPSPIPSIYLPRIPAVILRETSYNKPELKTFVEDNLRKLTGEQKLAYDTVQSKVDKGEGGFIFMDAPGGTGKTFTSTVMLANNRSNDKIALAVASTGIAASLLPGGTTAHRLFKLPLDLDKDEYPSCNIELGTPIARLLELCCLIVWDECTMTHKKALESVNRLLQDVRKNKRLFGGVVMLLTGDFRQTLPVVPGGTRADEINASLKSSVLWPYVQKLHLTINMRAHCTGDEDAARFSKILEDIGNGVLGQNTNGVVSPPPSLCVKNLSELLEAIFPNIEENYSNSDWLSERAILAPRNLEVNNLNYKLLAKVPEEERIYKSFDKVMKDNDATKYPIEFLNSLDPPGVPSHTLKLKKNVPVMLLRNLNPPMLCNGTRLQISKMHDNILEAKIISGEYKGEKVIIPRIPICPKGYPFEFKRIQFPVKVCFAMTINKSQGNTLKKVGLALDNACFSHGQFYVGCSRVGREINLKIMAPDNKTVNVVYQEIL